MKQDCSRPSQVGSKCAACYKSGQPCTFQQTVEETLDRLDRSSRAIQSAPLSMFLSIYSFYIFSNFSL